VDLSYIDDTSRTTILSKEPPLLGYHRGVLAKNVLPSPAVGRYLTVKLFLSGRLAMGRTKVVRLVSILLALGAVGFLGGQEPYNSTDGIALQGYDVVAYHREGTAVPGEATLSTMWNGREWHFSSEANREAFLAEPESYVPAYGGYCAWAAAEGYIATVDPEVFHLADGTLYLNYSRGIGRRWQRDISGNIRRANENWPRLRAGLLGE
jgi:YHS domain-containing protein